VILTDSIYHMWYSGGDEFLWEIGYATSTDGINWIKNPTPVLTDIDYTEKHTRPAEYQLDQNYPNPFNPKTVIRYSLPVTCHLDLSIYNLLGQKVATLVSERQQPGQHQIKWDASGFANGIYFYRLQAGYNYTATKKMLLIR
jgi:hypothetical protein